MASKLAKRASARASLLRQSTTGPLEEDNNPLSLSVPRQASPLHSRSENASPSTPSPAPRSPTSPAPPSPSNYRFNPDDPGSHTKDLSFLLHASFYPPISQSTVPPRFRQQLNPISPSTPISDSLAELDRLTSTGNFLAAAHLTAGILTSSALDPTDVKTIADLLSTRYACLELTGNTLLAAQESKVLEDLNSEFYYTVPAPPPIRLSHPEPKLPSNHVLPFSLRVQASRLQSIGFSDPRRGISTLYDLGLECREHIISPSSSASERDLWSRRLSELGIRVVNSLIEINDLECAKRMLRTLGPLDDVNLNARMALLLLKIGDVSAARELLEDSAEGIRMLKPLLYTAEGRYEEAAQEWEQFLDEEPTSHLRSTAQQNLAVDYLYTGHLKEARRLMENEVGQGEGYASLTFNLATIYELSSEKARDLKMDLANRVSLQDNSAQKSWVKSNLDFKL